MGVILLNTVDALSLVLVTYVLYLIGRALSRRATRTGRQVKPPGPPGLPFVGNAYQIPHDKQWLRFDEWIRRYGDLVHISVMGQPTVIIGSAQTASELLDARGSIYSDRPQAVMAGELVGWDQGLGYAPGPHSPRFREFRRLFQQFMGPRAAQDSSMLAAQEKSATRLLSRLLSTPEEFITHVRQVTGALILYLTYGYEVDEDGFKDPLVNIAEEAMLGFARASDPGAYLVDTMPWLKYIPEWFPGASFKQDVKAMRQARERLYDVPYNFVQKAMAEGPVPRSFVSTYVEEKATPAFADEELIKAAAASLYSGGADTTPSSLASFILAMTLHPDVQRRAQVELDSVIGESWQRLPTFADRPNLPYIDAIVLEVLRWHPAVPLGLAHRLSQDDVYRGYYFSQGTVFWANIWTMLHDEIIFPDPSRFMPERYLDEHGRLKSMSRFEDPAVIGFGFGRRICPGMHFAHNSIFIAIARMLYVFNFTKAVDKNGNEITPEVEYSGFISHPKLARLVKYEVRKAPASWSWCLTQLSESDVHKAWLRSTHAHSQLTICGHIAYRPYLRSIVQGGLAMGRTGGMGTVLDKQYEPITLFSMPKSITLYTAKICPYAQRAEIALALANVPYTRYEIDLKNKPEWYLPKVNPVGKVPAIAYGGPDVPPDQPSPESVKLNESLVLVEFIADLYPDSGILPKDPVLRAKARLFIDAVSNKFNPAAGPVVQNGGDTGPLVAAVEHIQSLLPPQGFAIGEFSAADIAIAPFIARAELRLENDIGAYPEGEGQKILNAIRAPHLARWQEYSKAVLAHPAVASTFDREYVLEAFKKRFADLRAKTA